MIMIINKKASVPILIFLFIMFVALWLDITLISYSPVNTPKDKPVALNTPKTTIKPKGDEKEDKTKPTISPPNRFTLDTIYFNFDGLSEQGKKYINGIIEAKNTNSYNKSLKDKKTEVRFYGFAGALKYAPNLATANLEPFLLSNSSVKMKYQQQDINTTLGYAVILLLKETPNTFLGDVDKSTFKNMEQKIEELYTTYFANSKNSAISNMYTNLMKEKFSDTYTKIATAISDNIYTDTENKTPEEKLVLSKSIETISEDKKDIVILALLKESNEQIVFNTLKNMGVSSSRAIADSIKKIFVTNSFSFSKDTKILAIQKYCSILKLDSISTIEEFMKTLLVSETSIVTACLQEIYNYGNDSSYEFLKAYLELVYPVDINLLATKTIIKTTYSTKPLNVFKTLIFTIVYYQVLPVTEYSIRFYINNNVKTDSQLILERIHKKESDSLKTTGLDYIYHFKITNEIPFVESLLDDENVNVRNRANIVLEALKKPEI